MQFTSCYIFLPLRVLPIRPIKIIVQIVAEVQIKLDRKTKELFFNGQSDTHTLHPISCTCIHYNILLRWLMLEKSMVPGLVPLPRSVSEDLYFHFHQLYPLLLCACNWLRWAQAHLDQANVWIIDCCSTSKGSHTLPDEWLLANPHQTARGPMPSQHANTQQFNRALCHDHSWETPLRHAVFHYLFLLSVQKNLDPEIFEFWDTIKNLETKYTIKEDNDTTDFVTGKGEMQNAFLSRNLLLAPPNNGHAHR